MLIKDIMTTNVVVLQPDATVREAAEIMRDIDTGFLPICEGKNLHGTLTDRDIVIRVIAEGLSPNKVAVKTAMSKNVLSVFEDQEVDVAARLMSDSKVRRLVVLDKKKQLSGIISLGDLWSHISQAEMGAEVLGEVANTSDHHVH